MNHGSSDCRRLSRKCRESFLTQVALSTRRARCHHSLVAKDPLVAEENDKLTVIALREIAEGLH